MQNVVQKLSSAYFWSLFAKKMTKINFLIFLLEGPLLDEGGPEKQPIYLYWPNTECTRAAGLHGLADHVPTDTVCNLLY